MTLDFVEVLLQYKNQTDEVVTAIPPLPQSFNPGKTGYNTY